MKPADLGYSAACQSNCDRDISIRQVMPLLSESDVIRHKSTPQTALQSHHVSIAPAGANLQGVHPSNSPGYRVHLLTVIFPLRVMSSEPIECDRGSPWQPA